MRRTYIRRQCGNTVRVPKKAAEESYINFWLVQPLSSSMLLLWLRWAPTKNMKKKKYSSNREEPHNFITISYYGWNCLFYCKHILFMEFFLEGSAPLRIWKINSEEKIWICFSYQLGLCLNEAILSKKYFIKASARDLPSKKVNDLVLNVNLFTNKFIKQRVFLH